MEEDGRGGCRKLAGAGGSKWKGGMEEDGGKGVKEDRVTDGGKWEGGMEKGASMFQT